jgi:hypothetical protein
MFTEWHKARKAMSGLNAEFYLALKQVIGILVHVIILRLKGLREL